MDMNEFNGTAIRTEDSEHVYFDLRPFGNRQGEAMDSYLHQAVMSISDGSQQLWREADCPGDGRFDG
jgi:hypothetical protein